MITINTHTLIKEMIAHGITEKHAEIMVNKFVNQKQFKQLEETIVKPSEFKEAVGKLESKIDKLEYSIKLDIAKTKNETLYWLIPFFLTNIGLIITVLLRMLAK